MQEETSRQEFACLEIKLQRTKAISSVKNGKKCTKNLKYKLFSSSNFL